MRRNCREGGECGRDKVGGWRFYAQHPTSCYWLPTAVPCTPRDTCCHKPHRAVGLQDASALNHDVGTVAGNNRSAHAVLVNSWDWVGGWVGWGMGVWQNGNQAPCTKFAECHNQTLGSQQVQSMHSTSTQLGAC